MRDKISLCLIVGNEPIHLERCLTQFAPAVGEMVVVHATGSVPRDVRIAEICQRHGAAYDIYSNEAEHADWPHVDSFAAARQKSFDIATKPWALWVDADDTPGPNFADALHELLTKFEADNFDAFCLFHDVAGRGIAHNIRERLVRREAGKWVNRIHENFQLKEGAKIARCDSPVVVHLPHADEPKQGSDRNLRILESIPEAERDISALYHLHGELMARPERKAEAVKLAADLARRPDCKPTERYELFLNLCEMVRPAMLETNSAEYTTMLTALHAAYKCQPNRREALALLGAMHLDLGDMVTAEAYLRAMMALPRPEDKPWTHRDGLYGWAGETLWTQFLRMTGQTQKADSIERTRIAQHKFSISIIHPTRGRPEQAAQVRKRWLDAAANPDRIEHIFGMEADSPDLELLARFRHATSPAGQLDKTNCVAATNAAARASVGKVLIYCQDDTPDPPLHWDAAIEEELGDKLNKPAILQIRDGIREDGLICIPCMTRQTLKALGYAGGIYCDQYRSMFADTELTWRALKGKWIVPSRLIIRHINAMLVDGVEQHETTARSNSPANYRQGYEVFKQRNPDYYKQNPEEEVALLAQLAAFGA